LIVSYGGTGRTTLITHGILIGEGTDPVTALTLSDGQLLIGRAGLDPLPASLTAGSNISITSGSGSITIAASGSISAAFSLIGNTGIATATGGVVNVVGDTIQGISTQGDGNSLT